MSVSMAQEQNEQYGAGVDKALVRQSFNRAANQYDAHAVLQREVAARMLSRLTYIRHQPERVLDAGCGTGFGVKGLCERYPQANIVALDLAEAMLKLACPSRPFWQKWRQTSVFPVCGDLDRLPLPDAAVDMVWSSLALQWSNDLRASFAELRRVLAPGGLLMFATFGPDTLKELRSAFARVDTQMHVNHFIDMHDMGDWLMQAGFSAPVMDMEFITLTYPDLRAMLHDLKAIGAHNVMQGRSAGLMGRARWQALESAMESFRQAGQLPLTYEVVYGHAWVADVRPDVKTQTVQWHRRVMS